MTDHLDNVWSAAAYGVATSDDPEAQRAAAHDELLRLTAERSKGLSRAARRDVRRRLVRAGWSPSDAEAVTRFGGPR